MQRRTGVVLFILLVVGSACGAAATVEGQTATESTASAAAATDALGTPEPTPSPTARTSELGSSFWSGPLGLFPLAVRVRPGHDPDTSAWQLDIAGFRFACDPTPSADGWSLDDCVSTLPDLGMTASVPSDPDGVMTVALTDDSTDPPMDETALMRRVRDRDEELSSDVTRVWRTPASTRRGTSDLWSADGVIYAANLGGFVELLDAGTGELLSVVDLAPVVGLGGPAAAVYDVKARSGLLYVATAAHGVLIYDVSDASTPTFAGRYFTPRADDAQSDGAWNIHNIYLAPERAVLFLINQSDTNQDLRLLDVSNPSAPFEIGRYGVPNPLDEDLFPHDVNVVMEDGREIAYVNYWDAGLRILDTTNAAAIVELGVWDAEGVHSHAGWPFELGDRRYYAHGGEGYDQGLTIVDVTNPASPVVTGSYESRDGISIHNLEVRDGIAYIAYYIDGLRVVDLNDPAHPTEIGHYDTVRARNEQDLFDGAWGVRLEGDRVYVSDRQSGVFAFSVQLPPTE